MLVSTSEKKVSLTRVQKTDAYQQPALLNIRRCWSAPSGQLQSGALSQSRLVGQLARYLFSANTFSLSLDAYFEPPYRPALE